MITPGDDYPLHQTSRPVRDPGTERNLYDRFFFNGYDTEGSVFFAVALGLYPGRNVMDAAFSVIRDGVQHNVRASRILGADRLDTGVGPISVTIVEPLRRLRVDVDDEESGIKASLTFTARGPAFEEPRYLWQPGHRVTFDITRMTQNGDWSGSLGVGGDVVEVVPERVVGTRDRSWGVRPIGERETGGAPDGGGFGFYWLWAPLNLPDECVLFDVNENPDGSRWHESAMRADASIEAVPESGAATYDLDFATGTRHARFAELRLELPSGKRSYRLEPFLHFYMQGIGYGHPQWGHAMYVGPDVRSYDTLATAEADETSPLSQHIQALCRVTRDDGVVGVGTFEQLIFGPHAPSGFKDILDFA